MAVKYLGDGRYMGLAADTKPTNAATNAEIWVTDTDDIYRYNGTSWVLLRADDKTETLTNKTVDIDSTNKLITRNPHKWTVYRTGESTGSVKAYNNQTGVVDFTDTDGYIDNILNSIYSVAGYRSVEVSASSGHGVVFPLSPSTTGIALNYMCELYMARGVRLRVPNGYTGDCIKIYDTVATGGHFNCLVRGGWLEEAGTAAHNWTAIHLYNDRTSAGNDFNVFEKMRIDNCGTGIKLECNSTTAWMNGNAFRDIIMYFPKIAIEFIDTQYVINMTGQNRNYFENIIMQAYSGSTNGIKNIQGYSNVFVDCKMWDMTLGGGAASTGNTVASKSRYTQIYGGIITPTNWTDDGLETIIIDQWNRQMPKLRIPDYLDTEVQAAAPTSPASSLSRTYAKSVDAQNNSLFTKVTKGGLVREYDLINTLRGPSSKRTGFWNGTAGTGGDGAFAGNLSNTFGTGSAFFLDTTEGATYQINTNATIDYTASLRSANSFTNRTFNPRLKIRFALGQAQTDSRLFFGYKNAPNTVPTDHDDYLNAVPGFMVALRAADTNWQIASNDNTGATAFTNYLRSGSAVAADTNFHTWTLIGDAAANRFGISLDGDPFQYVTTDIPAATITLGLHLGYETSTANARTVKVAWIEAESDK
jgi:hypothetical protein